MTNTKRGPGRPPKSVVETVAHVDEPDAAIEGADLSANPADDPEDVAPVRMADPATQNAPAAADVAGIKALMEVERAKIMAQARKEIEEAQAKAKEEAKAEAAKLVEEAMKAEAEDRAREDEQIRLARAAQDLVEVRVLPRGADVIFTGFLDDLTAKPLTYRRGDTFWVARSIANAQQVAGRVEIL